MAKKIAFCVFTFLFLGFSQHLTSQLKVTKLLCENLVNPIGLDECQPHFTWVISSDANNTLQQGYEVKVATNLSDLQKNKKLSWTSKQDKSNQSIHIPYEGSTLQSNTKYYWQVRVWDNKGRISPWSEVAFFHTGLFNKEDWKAKWINSGISADTVNGISPLLRKSFTIKKKIANATAFITSKGLYVAYLNGQKIGNDHLTPGWTSYKNRIQYQVYDVTSLLSAKENVVSAQLGSGWYRTNLGWSDNKNFYGKETALLLQLNIKYTDGSEEVVVTDDSWKSSKGPIQYSEIYNGEIYDARLEKENWTKVGFNDQSWQKVKVLDHGSEKIISTYNEPIRKRETFKPKEIIITPKGETVIDFGQNLVGWVKIMGSAQSGDVLQWKHFEVLDKNGNVYMNNMRVAQVNTTYHFKGTGVEQYTPTFTFYGFRYIWIDKGAELLKNVTFEAEVLYSDMPITGQFETSDPLINQLQHNIQWGQRGNFLDVPTDCPQRDERLGWTGDAQAFSRTAGYNFHVHNFFKKWLKDVAHDQTPEGAIPFVVPNILGSGASGSAGWADAATIIPWDMYVIYGDKRVLQDQYESMKKWVEFMRSKSKNNLWNTGFHFGDWLFFSRNNDTDGTSAVTDKYLIAQCFYAHSTNLLIKTAGILGKQEDVKEYTSLLAKIKKAYQDEYMTPNGRLIANTQTAYVLALNFDMLPENKTAMAAQYLVDNINRYNHLTTGFLGTPYLNHVLTKTGHDTIAYKLLHRKDYPSWLYPVTKGATTIWERWDGIQPDGNFQAESMNSFNHYAYGAIGDWMYQSITGIRPDEIEVGYKKFDIKPNIGGNLTFAKASLDTYYGPIKSGWEIIDGGLKLNVEIPVNTVANVYVPVRGGNMLINGQNIDSCAECKWLSSKDKAFKAIELGSGKYTFESK
jgi:alpha-L-rhamnosidase